jgi:hypothetical protein
MKTFYRVLVVIAMVIAVLMIVISAVGIVGSWGINERVTTSLLRVVDGAQALVNGIYGGLDRALQAVNTGQGIVAEINGRLSDAGEFITEGEPVIALVEKLLGEDLLQKINSARETIRTLTDAVASLNQFLVSLNDIPFVNVPTLTDELRTVEDRIDQVVSTIQDARLRFAEFKSGLVETLIDPVLQRTQQIESDLNEIETQLTTYMALAATTLAVLAEVEAKLPLWIDILTAILSFMLLWMLLGQAALLLAGYNYLKIGRFVLRAVDVASEMEYIETTEPVGEVKAELPAEPVVQETPAQDKEQDVKTDNSQRIVD